MSEPEQQCAREGCKHFRPFHRSPIVSDEECDMPGCGCRAFVSPISEEPSRKEGA